MAKTKICFATWELKGFTAGGIGVLISNILGTFGDDPRSSLSILWYGGRSLDAAAFRAAFPNCVFYSVDDFEEDCADDAVYPPKSAYRVPAHANSTRLMRALRAIEARDGAFDFIEFPDFDGAALATLQEKRLGRAFRDSTICVRLHSTESILRTVDHRPIVRDNALRGDIERKALADADLVIAHLSPIARSIKELFGFPESWMDKVCVELPPVRVGRRIASGATRFVSDTPLILSSKVQWIKRPAVFINGVVGFMRRTPDYRGKAYLLAHVIDDELKRHCEQLIPADLSERFSFMSGMADERREALIARSVVVFASAYESFCLAAYEASLLGAIVVVNRANPGFGGETPWIDGVNCVAFDESASALADALSQAWITRGELALKPVSRHMLGMDAYWGASRRAPRPRESVLVPKVSFAILCGRDHGDPLDTIAGLLSANHAKREIVLAFEALSGEPDHELLVERAHDVENIKIASLEFRGGEAALANLAVRSATGDLVVMARAGTVFDPKFIDDAVRALCENPHYDAVLPQLAYPSADGSTCDHAFIGEATGSAGWDNHFGSLEFVARSTLLKRVVFDENLDRYVDLDFHLRSCLGGSRYIMANDIGAVIDLGSEGRNHFFRSHLDSVFAKHGAVVGGGSMRLISIIDSSRSATMQSQAEQAPSIQIGKRDLRYYMAEARPWWKIAINRPTKLTRWLVLREVQKMKDRST